MPRSIEQARGRGSAGERWAVRLEDGGARPGDQAAKPRHRGGSLRAAQAEERALALTWRDGEAARVPYLWLRDNCACAACRIALTSEKRFNVQSVPADLRPHEVSLGGGRRGGRRLRLVWPDGHRSRYRAKDLRRLMQAPAQPLRHWGGEFRPRQFDHERFLAEDAAAAAFVEEFLVSGAAILVNAPTAPNSLENLAPRLGPLRETVFERIHNVAVDPRGYNIAHTAEYVPPHNDMVSYSWPPSVQALHMLVNECAGGETVLVDGFRALESLRREAPGLFNVLCEVAVPFRLFSEDDETYAVNPMVQLDGAGAVRMLRFSNQTMQPIPLSEPRLEAFYEAYRALSERLQDPAAQARFRLAAGQILIVSGHRVLHGRMPLAGPGRRHLQDGYFEHDNVRNHLVVLKRKRRV